MCNLLRACALCAALLALGTGCVRSAGGGSGGSTADKPTSSAAVSSATPDTSSSASLAVSTATLPVYFALSDPSGMVGYALAPDGTGGEALPADLPHALVESGSGMLYGIRRDDTGEVWLERVPPDGNGGERLVQDVSGFTIVGDTLFYEISDPSGFKTIYAAALDGTDPQEIPGNRKQYSTWYIADGLHYYTDAPYGKEDLLDAYSSIVAWNPETQEATAVYKPPNAHALCIRGIWGDKLVYSDLYADGAGSGFIDLATGETTPLDSVSPKVMVAGDALYYAGDGDGNDLWRWTAGADAPEKLITGQMGHFYQQEDWVYFCPDDSFLGWQRYSLATGETQSLPDAAAGLPIPRSQPDRQPSALYDS